MEIKKSVADITKKYMQNICNSVIIIAIETEIIVESILF